MISKPDANPVLALVLTWFVFGLGHMIVNGQTNKWLDSGYDYGRLRPVLYPWLSDRHTEHHRCIPNGRTPEKRRDHRSKRILFSFALQNLQNSG